MKKIKKQQLIIPGVCAFVLLLSLGAEYFIQIKPLFVYDGKPLFHAWFGFGACVVMVLAAKILGVFVKRSEGYYKENKHE